MNRDLVERRRWISEERFLNALNYCMLLPGPEAQQLAIYIGWLLHGTSGGIVAGALFVLPSVGILWSLSAAYAAWGTVPAVAGVVAGLKPVVVALVVAAVLRIGRSAFRPRWLVLVAAAAFAALAFWHVPFPAVILGAAALGAAGSRLRPRSFAATLDGESRNASPTATDSPESQERILRRPSLGRSARILAAGIALWALPYAAVLAAWGREGLFAQEYRFFTKAALVTFGGAYAVLAYVTQAAVESYGWISHAQAVDGLGLAETTPGPLIMVVQFVGFMAGWNHPPGGATRLGAATVGALVTTWVTFLPCFVLVFLGAPYIERLRAKRTLSGALRGVTAAVVGVILNLAFVFGSAVFFPAGVGHAPDLFAVALAAAAFLALTFTRVEAIWVIGGGAAAGLLFHVLGGLVT